MRHLREWLGLTKKSEYVQRYLDRGNMRSAIYMTVIVILLQIWMLLSYARYLIESAAAGRPRDLGWIVSHGWWYVALLASATVVLVYARRYLAGRLRTTLKPKVLLFLFSVMCIAFGIHYGNNSFAQGEQALAFFTMTLFVFGILVWTPLTGLIGSIVAFGIFYALAGKSAPITYGMQVNLLTLWISTFVVAFSSYRQRVAEATQAEIIEYNSERLQQLAMFDELTGIPNMHTFRGAASVLYEGTDELETRFTIIYFDIENFRAYNEKKGFLAGDALLCDVAEGLQKIFESELVARFSDDHFVALCESDVARARVEAAHELVRGLRGDVRLHLKAGLYEPPASEGLDVSLACDKARIACSSTKRKSDVVALEYDAALDREVQLRQYVINNVKTAVEQGWIKVFYQPVVRCADGSGALCGYEALARWDDPTYGLLPPFAFIETLEEYREIDKLDRCIIRQVCRDLRAELDAGGSPVPVSLNFSRLDFELYDVPAFLAEMAEQYQVPANLLDVEITESALTEQFDDLKRNMARLRAGGFSLWLDDFGSGYSSLNVLKDFRFDVLKIDMAFLRGFATNLKSRPILQSIVGLAKKLELVTLCEGVETREQFDFLCSIGCDRVQGYYFGRPEAVKQAPRSLEEA